MLLTHFSPHQVHTHTSPATWWKKPVRVVWYAPCLFPCYMQTEAACILVWRAHSSYLPWGASGKLKQLFSLHHGFGIERERESESLFCPWLVPFMSFLAYLFPHPSHWEDAGHITCWEQDTWEVIQQLSAPTPRPLFKTLSPCPEAIRMQSSTKNAIPSRLSIPTHLSCLFWVIKMYTQPNKWQPPFRSPFDTSGILK